MSDTPDDNNTSQGALVVQPPARADNLFHAVFVLSKSTADHPAPPVLAEAQAYAGYVQQLALRLDGVSRSLAARLQDEAGLARAAQELHQIEMHRRNALRPYLEAPQPAAAPAKAASGWPMLMARLRKEMGHELEALRDARLRLELRKAELINQRQSTQVRVVLKGGAQVRLFFGKRAKNAAPKG